MASFYQDRIKPLYRNNRFYILVGSLVLSLGIYIGVAVVVPPSLLRDIRLEQIFALTALSYLYLALLAAPLTRLVKNASFNVQYLHARRALSVAAFYFALLHAWLAFFDQLGGFAGLGFLGSKYITSAILGLTALFILFMLVATSLDYFVKKFSSRVRQWGFSLVYAAGILVVIHAFILGTHFSDLSSAIPRVLFVALAVLVTLESLRLDHFLQTKFPKLASIGVVTMLAAHVILIGLGVVIGVASSKSGGALSLNVHAAHIALAKQALTANQTATSVPVNSQNPTLIGDRNKHYTVTLLPTSADPGQLVQLRFRIFDASSGTLQTNFQQVYSKIAHLVILDDSLTYYDHIHPEIDPATGELVITTTFPAPGFYRLYLNFQPVGAIEQQIGFSMQVGGTAARPVASTQPISQALTQTFGGYQVSINSNSFSASQLSLGEQYIKFIIKTASGQPVTTLKPYLAAFGHLMMVNQQTYDYIHVHPTNITPPAPDANSGPEVDFLPLGLYGPIKPGTYRVFAQFNPNNQLILADFTVKLN